LRDERDLRTLAQRVISHSAMELRRKARARTAAARRKDLSPNATPLELVPGTSSSGNPWGRRPGGGCCGENPTQARRRKTSGIRAKTERTQQKTQSLDPGEVEARRERKNEAGALDTAVAAHFFGGEARLNPSARRMSGPGLNSHEQKQTE
jgi:hypothetical protein